MYNFLNLLPLSRSVVKGQPHCTPEYNNLASTICLHILDPEHRSFSTRQSRCPAPFRHLVSPRHVQRSCPTDPKSCDIDTYSPLLVVSDCSGNTLMSSVDSFVCQSTGTCSQHDDCAVAVISNKSKKSTPPFVETPYESKTSQTFLSFHPLVTISTITSSPAGGWDITTIPDGALWNLPGRISLACSQS